MKFLFLLLFVCNVFGGRAANYYFSSAGNDNNNGMSPQTPWHSILKFNTVVASGGPGDSYLFNRGDVFYGNLIISRGGTAESPIIIGAYGTGKNPVITGLTNVTAWTNLNGNVWESTNAISKLSHCNVVVVNGVNTCMGRYPN